MSPEQARGEDVDASADLWALRRDRVQLLSGRRPFPGVHPATVLHAIIYEPAPDRSRCVPTCPSACARWSRKALAKDKAARHRRRSAARGAARGNNRGPDGKAARSRSRLRSPRVAVPLAVGLLARRGPRRAPAVEGERDTLGAEQALPEIARSPKSEQFVEAFALADVPRRRSRPTRCSPACGRPSRARPRLRSQPAGATVSYKPFDSPDDGVGARGVTPLQACACPRAFSTLAPRDLRGFTDPGSRRCKRSAGADAGPALRSPTSTLEAASRCHAGDDPGPGQRRAAAP